MSSDRILKMILKYQPKGKRKLGRPLKIWKVSIDLILKWKMMIMITRISPVVLYGRET
jgi:hypothetical protein